jgi:hypothetical protein
MIVRLVLLVLPLLQSATTLVAMLAASMAFNHPALTTDALAIIYNSAALLFVLELDNCAGVLVKRWNIAVAPSLLVLHEEPLQPRPRPAAALLGFAYAAVIGASVFLIPTLASSFFTFLASLRWIPTHTQYHQINNWAQATWLGRGATLRHTTLYGGLVLSAMLMPMVLLFVDPPLPATSTAWGLCHRVALVLHAGLSCFNTLISWDSCWTFRLLDCKVPVPRFVDLWAYFAIATSLWGILYVGWPAAAAAAVHARDLLGPRRAQPPAAVIC